MPERKEENDGVHHDYMEREENKTWFRHANFNMEIIHVFGGAREREMVRQKEAGLNSW